MDVRTFRSESAFGGRPRILGKAASTSGGNSVLALDDLKSSSVHSGLSLSTMTEVFLRDRISCSLFLAHCAKTDGSQASTTYRKGKHSSQRRSCHNPDIVLPHRRNGHPQAADLEGPCLQRDAARFRA